jgi:hypothetical protein
MEFKFKCSYLDQCEYSVYGHSKVKEVEEYNAPQHTLDYYRSIYNHTTPNCFENDVLLRQGGVKCGYFAEHWDMEVWDAYCAFKRKNHEDAVAYHYKMIEKYGTDWTGELPVLVIPRPIYYDREKHRWETENWYQAAAPEDLTAASASEPVEGKETPDSADTHIAESGLIRGNSDGRVRCAECSENPTWQQGEIAWPTGESWPRESRAEVQQC